MWDDTPARVRCFIGRGTKPFSAAWMVEANVIFGPEPQEYFRIGCGALAHKDLEVARAAFLRAIETHHPNIRHCYYRLAYVAHLQGDEAAAEEYFQKAFDLEPNDSVTDQGDGSTLLVPYPKGSKR